MPDRFQQTLQDVDAKAWRPEHSYESVWMGHWMQTSCNTASRFLNNHAIHDGSKEEEYTTIKGALPVQSVDPRKAATLDEVAGPHTASDWTGWRCQQGSLKVVSDVPSSSRADGVETEDGRAKITSDKLAMNSRSLSNAGSQWHSFPVSRFNQNNDRVLSPITELAYCDRHTPQSQINDTSGHGLTTIGTSETNFPSRLFRVTSSEVEFPAKHHYSQPVSTTQCPINCGKSYGFVEKKRLPLSESSLYDLPGSTSKTVLCTYKSGETPMQSFMYRNKETDQSICLVASKDRSTNSNFTPAQKNYNYCSSPRFLGCEKGKDNQLRARHSGISCLRQKDVTLQISNPSTSNFNFLISVGEQNKDINGFSGTGVSSTCSIPHRETELEESNPGSHILQRMPACAVHDAETLRICSTMEGASRGRPKFSQTTHHLFMTNNISVNLSKWDQIIRESNLSADFNRNALHELLSLPSHCHVEQGPKLQLLGNTTYTEGKAGTRDVGKGCLPLYKELSAETDTMDIDHCDNRNTSHDIFSLPSNPVTAQATLVSPRKVGTGKTELEVPDTSRGPIAILAAKGSTGKRGISDLMTDSLNVEHLPHEQPAVYLNSSLQQDVPEAQPSYELVKRLKLSASNSLAHGKKNSRNTSSGEKVNNLFTKIMSYNISSSEPTWSKKRQMELDKSVVLFRNLETYSMGSTKDDKDLTLSHPWIQRWCHSQAEIPLKKPTASVVCEPNVLKPTSKKQLPSIAAMALMGKASNSYRPCEFRKRGPVIVWNTEVL